MSSVGEYAVLAPDPRVQGLMGVIISATCAKCARRRRRWRASQTGASRGLEARGVVSAIAEGT